MSSFRNYTVRKEEIILGMFHFDSFVSLPYYINRNVLNRKTYFTYLNNQPSGILSVTIGELQVPLFLRKSEFVRVVLASLLGMYPFTLKT